MSDERMLRDLAAVAREDEQRGSELERRGEQQERGGAAPTRRRFRPERPRRATTTTELGASPRVDVYPTYVVKAHVELASGSTEQRRLVTERGRGGPCSAGEGPCRPGRRSSRSSRCPRP